MRVIEKWAIDKEKFVFDIKGGSGKTQVVYTEYAFVCSQYLSELPKLLKRAKWLNICLTYGQSITYNIAFPILIIG